MALCVGDLGGWGEDVPLGTRVQRAGPFSHKPRQSPFQGQPGPRLLFSSFNVRMQVCSLVVMLKCPRPMLKCQCACVDARVSLLPNAMAQCHSFGNKESAGLWEPHSLCALVQGEVGAMP